MALVEELDVEQGAVRGECWGKWQERRPGRQSGAKRALGLGPRRNHRQALSRRVTGTSVPFLWSRPSPCRLPAQGGVKALRAGDVSRAPVRRAQAGFRNSAGDGGWVTLTLNIHLPQDDPGPLT